MRLAVIDAGTNTTRLLVAEPVVGAGYRDLDRRLMFTRLGRGVDSDGRISPDAMRRTIEAIGEFLAVCGELEVTRVKVAATSAVRDAANREEFLEDAGRISGVPVELLSGEDEAGLSFRGAVADLEPGEYLVCDIGGGSTEFFLGRSDAGAGGGGGLSLDLGSVRLTERYLRSDPPEAAELSALEGAVEGALAEVSAALPGAASTRLVGVAGTVTSLAALKLALPRYDPSKTHHLRLTRAEIETLYRELASTPLARRERLPSLPPGRADVIVAGAGILVSIMRAWSFHEVIVSERDILDGLMMEMLAEIDREGARHDGEG